MQMDPSAFFILFFSLLISSSEALDTSCRPVKCGEGGFDVRFPFRLKPHQPQNCGVGQSFDLYCRDNSTMIHFPSYGDLVVKSLSYDARKLNLLDPQSCVHEVFLNLNLSLTPFRYYYVLKDYTYLNCSVSLGPSVIEVPCLSGSQHHVYTLESPVPVVPDYCRPIKTVAIPFGYSSYLSDSSFGLGLTWDQLSDQPEDSVSGLQSETGWSYFRAPMIGGGTVLLVLVAAMLISMKILYTKRLDSHGHARVENQFRKEFVSHQHQSLLHYQSC